MAAVLLPIDVWADIPTLIFFLAVHTGLFFKGTPHLRFMPTARHLQPWPLIQGVEPVALAKHCSTSGRTSDIPLPCSG